MASHAHIPGCARLNVMRLNAARLNYYESIVSGSVGGVDRSRNLRIEGAAIQHALNDVVDTAAVSCHGFTPVAGQKLDIYDGDRSPAQQLFGGHILQTTVRYESKHQNVAWDLAGIDPTWLLNRQRVLERYIGAGAKEVIANLIVRFTRGIDYYTYVSIPNTIIDEITFTNETVAACLTAICERIGAYWYLDYQNGLHVFTQEVTNANSITDAAGHTSSDHQLTEDLSQVVTRVIGRGMGAGAAVDLPANATEVPIDLGDQQNWYSLSGGLAEVNAMRLTYAGVRGLGAVGALVGSGNAPSNAPVITQAGGASSLVPGGVYKYAVSFLTASGETLPGPTASGAASGAMPPNPVQPTIRDAAYGPSPGDINQPVIGGIYYLRITFPFDGPSYGISNPTGVVWTGKYWQLYVGPTALSPLGIYYYPALHPGGVAPTARYRQIWIDRTAPQNNPDPFGAVYYGAGHLDVPQSIVYNEWVTISPVWSDSDTIAGGGGIHPQTPGPPYDSLYLNQLPKSALPAVTARKLYRTAAAGTQLKLLATLNATDTAYIDRAADATLGANAPTADTSAIPSDTAQQVVAGSTVLPVSGTAPFENDGGAGWARVGNMVIQYTGIGAGTLTGLPASGPGALSATVRYGAQVLVQPRLVGVVGLTRSVRKGDNVAIRLEVEDVAAQDALAARLGGVRADGVVEEPYSDSRMTLRELQEYTEALLADRKDPRRTLRFDTRDTSCEVGRLITVTLTTPPISGTFRIQRVTFSEIAITGGLGRVLAKRSVEASSKLFTFADLLRRLRGREGGAL